MNTMKLPRELKDLLVEDSDIDVQTTGVDKYGNTEHKLRVHTEDSGWVSLNLHYSSQPEGNRLFYSIHRKVEYKQTTNSPKEVVAQVKKHAKDWV